MQEHTEIRDLGSRENQEAIVRGWLYARRESGKIRFLVVRDGTGYLQCVAAAQEIPPEVFALCGTLGQESSVEVRGPVRREARAPGGFEMGLRDLKVLHAAHDYPITPKEHGPEFLLDHRHLWLRSSRPHALLRIRNEVCQGCREFFYSRGYVLIDSPMFTPAACEGTSTLFETDYFGEKAYLTQSGQLYLEPACMAFGKVYCFGPTFRAEKSKTRRHLTEFWMLEPEIAFAELPDIMALAEELVVALVVRVLDRSREDLKVLERDTSRLEKIVAPFHRMSYDEAAQALSDPAVQARAREQGAPPFEPGGDFGGFDETVLTEKLDRPVIVTHYPTALKAFYMQPDPANPERVLCMDVLAPEGYGEIIGGSQRIHDHDLLLSRIREHRLPEEAFRWYLEIRKYGTVPHAGFGMGIERLVSWIAGVRHLREAIPYPRMLHRLYP
ncbi:MAG TPA: asparagine--tRNA ligase [Candidatus Polarisedimenticolia bacterium]|jgi:asparaginyl-tRNA synthetase|nr:asparagine--tRNA ligase [Candidatus Polarisedimenticolia bacterium]